MNEKHDARRCASDIREIVQDILLDPTPTDALLDALDELLGRLRTYRVLCVALKRTESGDDERRLWVVDTGPEVNTKERQWKLRRDILTKFEQAIFCSDLVVGDDNRARLNSLKARVLGDRPS